MVGVVSSIPSEGNFIFADFETPDVNFCTKMPEMSGFCYLGKTLVTNALFVGMHLKCKTRGTENVAFSQTALTIGKNNHSLQKEKNKKNVIFTLYQ